MTALMDRWAQRRTNGLSRGAGERFMGSPAQAGDAGLVVTPGGGGYRDGNPYTANELGECSTPASRHAHRLTVAAQ